MTDALPPLVSLVVPCRNEAGFIGECLGSLVNQDFPSGQCEILLVDGGSTDGTRDIIGEWAVTHRHVRLVDNPAGSTPAGMNVGVRAARGGFIFILGAHNRYAPDFVRKGVAYHRAWHAEAVGGVMETVPRDRSWFGEAVALALSHPFGVGGSRFRTRPSMPVWVDAAFGCCYRREVFERIGLFNERLLRGQDMELNLRLRSEGGRILLAPDMVSWYAARSRAGEFWRHTWTNGRWAIVPFLHSPIRPVRLRHLVPLGFVIALLTLGLGAIVSRTIAMALVGVALAYVLALFGGAAQASIIARRPRVMVTLPPVFALLHLAYGLGSLRGLLDLLAAPLRGRRRPTRDEAWPRLAAQERTPRA